jgi:hypothetical protein
VGDDEEDGLRVRENEKIKKKKKKRENEKIKSNKILLINNI